MQPPSTTASRPLKIRVHSLSIALRTRIAIVMRTTPAMMNHTAITMTKDAAIDTGFTTANTPKSTETRP